MFRLLGCCALLIVVFGCSAEFADAPRRIPLVGEHATMHTRTVGAEVPVAVSRDDFYRLGKLSTAKNYNGISHLYASGRVWNVDEGTLCQVVDLGMATEVRILSGSSQGKSCFVSSSFLRKKNSQ